MKSLFGIAVLVAAGLVSGNVQASNGLLLSSNDPLSNVATLSISGDDNVLSINQSYGQTGGANVLSLDISGDLNGGPLNRSFSGVAATSGLVPGEIRQSGHDNFVGLQVTGTQNLFAISQIGSGNTLTAMMIGNNNQASISQLGNGNNVSFVQNGSGNILSVIQRNW